MLYPGMPDKTIVGDGQGGFTTAGVKRKKALYGTTDPSVKKYLEENTADPLRYPLAVPPQLGADLRSPTMASNALSGIGDDVAAGAAAVAPEPDNMYDRYLKSRSQVPKLENPNLTLLQQRARKMGSQRANLQYNGVIDDLDRELGQNYAQGEQAVGDVGGWFQTAGGTAKEARGDIAARARANTKTYQADVKGLMNLAGASGKAPLASKGAMGASGALNVANMNNATMDKIIGAISAEGAHQQTNVRNQFSQKQEDIAGKRRQAIRDRAMARLTQTDDQFRNLLDMSKARNDVKMQQYGLESERDKDTFQTLASEQDANAQGMKMELELADRQQKQEIGAAKALAAAQEFMADQIGSGNLDPEKMTDEQWNSLAKAASGFLGGYEGTSAPAKIQQHINFLKAQYKKK